MEGDCRRVNQTRLALTSSPVPVRRERTSSWKVTCWTNGSCNSLNFKMSPLNWIPPECELSPCPCSAGPRQASLMAPWSLQEVYPTPPSRWHRAEPEICWADQRRVAGIRTGFRGNCSLRRSSVIPQQNTTKLHLNSWSTWKRGTEQHNTHTQHTQQHGDC